MRRSEYAALIFLCLLTPSLAWAQATSTYPHRPDNATTLIDEPWNSFNSSSSTVGTGWTNIYIGCNGSIVSDSSAPQTPNNVYRAKRNAGSATGGCALDRNHTQTSRIYGSVRFKTSNPFWGVNAHQHKLTGYLSQAAGHNHFIRFDLVGNGGPWTLRVGFNTSSDMLVDNCHLRGQPGFANPIASECNQVYGFDPNVTYVGIGAGTWYHLEWIFQRNTCSTCNDGIIKVWVNSTLTTNFTNVKHAPANWFGWNLTHTWDGQAMENQGVESYFDFDHFYLASYAGDGGGALLDNPPGPPGTVTGVTVTVQ